MSQRQPATEQWGRGSEHHECIGCRARTILSWRGLCIGCEIDITSKPRPRPRSPRNVVKLDRLIAELHSRTDDRSTWPANLLRAALAARRQGVDHPLVAEAAREYKRRHEHNRRNGF